MFFFPCVDIKKIVFEYDCFLKILRAMWNDIAVEGFFPLSYGTFKQCDVSDTIDLLDMAYRSKNVSF